MKNRRQSQVNMILMLSVSLIVGVVLLQIVFSTITNATSTTAVTNDPFLVANGTCTRVTTDCILTTTSITNRSATVTNNFTTCGSNGDLFGYTLIASGGGNDFVGDTFNASYSEISCDRLPAGITTTLAGILPALFGLVLIVFVSGFLVLRR